MIKKAEIATGLAIVLVSALMTGCAKKEPIAENKTVGTGSEELTWGRATVTGDVQGLKAFDDKVKEALGDTDLEAHLIRCVEGCDKLSESQPPAQLVYYFSREHLSIFGNAWDAGQTAVGDALLFKLLIDRDIPMPDCPVKAGCQPIYTCSDWCGKKGPPVNCNFC